MVKIIDIYKAINRKINDHFPKVPIYSNEIDENFKRDCFFVKLIPLLVENTTVNSKAVQILVDIKYFNQNGQEIELITMNDELMDLFGMYLRVKDRNFYIEKFNTVYHDYEVLQLTFELDYYLKNNTDKDIREIMRDLVFHVEKE